MSVQAGHDDENFRIRVAAMQSLHLPANIKIREVETVIAFGAMTNARGEEAEEE